MELLPLPTAVLLSVLSSAEPVDAGTILYSQHSILDPRGNRLNNQLTESYTLSNVFSQLPIPAALQSPAQGPTTIRKTPLARCLKRLF